MKHFLSIKDFSKSELLEMIDLAIQIKAEVKNGHFVPRMKNKTLAMIFEKNSTRTRVSFEVGIYQLGGVGLFLSSKDLQLGRGEPIKDTARVISSMCDMVMIRTYEHEKLEEFAAYSKVPLINGLSDSYHPVQLMADYMTMVELGCNDNPIVAYIGDGNNMAHSWINLATKLEFELRIATPKGYECDKKIVDAALASGGKIIISNDPVSAVKDVNVVTTDVWTSMGQEEEYQKRLNDFQGFMVNSNLMNLAKPNALFLHCLPAHRGEEVSDEVMESTQSAVWQEAENRLHAQKAIMVWLDQRR